LLLIIFFFGDPIVHRLTHQRQHHLLVAPGAWQQDHSHEHETICNLQRKLRFADLVR